MSQARQSIKALREKRTIREEQTGRVLEKPEPPPMREGVGGAWTFR